MTEPLMRLLQSRGERITVGALPWVAPVYRAMEAVAEVIELPFAHGGLQWKARRTLGKQLKGRFARAIICPNSLKSALLPWWAEIPERVGYHGEARFGLLTRRLPNPDKYARPPMVDWYAALAGASAPHLVQPRLQIDRALARSVLQSHQLREKEFFVLVPGAEYGPAKRWPMERFAELAQRLAHDHAMPVLLLGSAKDAALCADIAAHVDVQAAPLCRNLAGQTNLEHAMALAALARAMVSNDSGMMHVAAALNVPQVAIFGSSSPLHTPPLSAHAKVLWLKSDSQYTPPLDCAPCFARQCPLGHTRCLSDISTAMVLAQLPV